MLQTLPTSWYPTVHTIRDVVRWTLMSIGIRQELSESGMSGKNWTAFESTFPLPGEAALFPLLPSYLQPC